jgi:GTP cyclohydrolase I
MSKVIKNSPDNNDILQDTQNKADERNISICRVGIKDIKYPIEISDINDSCQNVSGNFTMSVSLPPEVKGTHMSRFVAILDERKKPLSINNFDDLINEVSKKLDSNKSYVSLDFNYFRRKKAPITKVESFLDYAVSFIGEKNYEIVNKFIKVTVPVTSLCPCSKNIWIEEIIEMLEEQASCQIYGLLKRPDEKFVTEEAYNNPKFVEDIIRDLALSLNKDERVSAYKIESENFESIHNHSAYAFIEKDKTKECVKGKDNVSFLKLSQLKSSCH